MEILDAIPVLYKDAIVRQFSSFNDIAEEPYFILSVGIVAGLLVNYKPVQITGVHFLGSIFVSDVVDCCFSRS